MLQDSQQTVEN